MEASMSKSRYVKIVVLFLGFLLCDKDQSLHLVMISGADDYFSDISLADYRSYLGEKYPEVKASLLTAKAPVTASENNPDLSGSKQLENAQVLLLFVDQTTLRDEKRAQIKRFIDSGKGLVAIRSTIHGIQNWPDFDRAVLGRQYLGHYPGDPEKSVMSDGGQGTPAGQPEGPTQDDQIVKASDSHPILTGIGDFRSRYSLYRTDSTGGKVDILMMGKIPDQDQEPVVWTNEYKNARIVYIGVGGLQDWENSTFKRLVTNSVYWAARRLVKTPESVVPQQRKRSGGQITLELRSERLAEKHGDQWQEYSLKKIIGIDETAIVICDMWDKHWCRGATSRCTQLAINMNPVLNAAREKGIQIIHAPSSTLAFYDDWPQRRRMTMAPAAAKPEELAIQDEPLPIDYTDGGCETGDKGYGAWTRQSPYIDISPYDGISDSGDEIYNYFMEQGIKNMIIMGVHTNMCILNRPFGIKQMTKWGIQCILVRDLTDAMYNPQDFPYVSHEKGVELVVQYIEKYWCPSTTSKDLIAAFH